MCGRFHNHIKAVHGWVDVLQNWPSDAMLGYNVSPTQLVPIVTGSCVLAARWGLVPSWEKAFTTRYPTHNARLETAKDKPSFRSAWKRSQTCLVPVAGFYEWRKEGSIKPMQHNGLKAVPVPRIFFRLQISTRRLISIASALMSIIQGAMACNLLFRLSKMTDWGARLKPGSRRIKTV